MPTPPSLLVRLAPALFVLIWSTGWIAAKFGAPDADPLTFLSVRFVLAAICLTLVAMIAGAPWPRTGAAWGHGMAAGVLLHGLYLGAVWWAIARGVPAGISGLIAAIQPILTALLAPRLIGETISRRQWAGIWIGLAGISLVLWPKLVGLDPAALRAVAIPLLVNIAGMVFVTLGTFYQKRFVTQGDLRTVTVLQYLGAAAVTIPIALATETLRLDWTPTLILTMAWSVVAISMGAIGLLMMLLRQGAVSRAAALIYLMPPVVAVEAFLIFGEALVPIQLLGLIVTSAGVALAVRRA
jgi:drug/metabolite transporter (DMT)-like permease